LQNLEEELSDVKNKYNVELARWESDKKDRDNTFKKGAMI